MEIIMPLIRLLSSSGLTRPAGQPQTAQVFADLLNKKVVETPGSILPEETLETIGDIDLPDEICERKKAGEIDFPETKIDLDIPVDADQKVVIDPEIIGAINPIVPTSSPKQALKLPPDVRAPAVQSPAKMAVRSDVEIPVEVEISERRAALIEREVPIMPLAADAEIDKATGPKQGIGRQVAAFHAPELHAMWAIETTQVSMADTSQLTLEIADIPEISPSALVGRLHTLPPAHVAPLVPQERQLARSAITQISEMVQQTHERGFDLRLKPPELGVVKMQFSYSEGGLIVHVAAERSDTSELIRRHADMLLQEFRQIGYSEQPTLTFGRNAQRQALFDAPKAYDSLNVLPDELQTPLPAPAHRLQASGLNIVM